MATPKSWTAHDLQLGKLTLRRERDEIHYEQRYEFVDEIDDVLSEVAGSRLVGMALAASLPSDILAALQTISNWLYAQCLEQEGMAE